MKNFFRVPIQIPNDLRREMADMAAIDAASFARRPPMQAFGETPPAVSAREQLLTLLVDENILAPEDRPASPPRRKSIVSAQEQNYEQFGRETNQPFDIEYNGPLTEKLAGIVKFERLPFPTRVMFKEDLRCVAIVVQCVVKTGRSAREDTWFSESARLDRHMFESSRDSFVKGLDMLQHYITRLFGDAMREMVKQCVSLDLNSLNKLK